MTPDLLTYGAQATYREACRRERLASKADKREALHAMLALETSWRGK